VVKHFRGYSTLVVPPARSARFNVLTSPFFGFFAASDTFFGIGKETGKRRVFLVKNGVFIGEFEDFGLGNEDAYDYAEMM
jgi:hypothetical protein